MWQAIKKFFASDTTHDHIICPRCNHPWRKHASKWGSCKDAVSHPERSEDGVWHPPWGGVCYCSLTQETLIYNHDRTNPYKR
jgi:hypothetical protein